jgi:hypothetical protein
MIWAVGVIIRPGFARGGASSRQSEHAFDQQFRIRQRVLGMRELVLRCHASHQTLSACAYGLVYIWK